MEWMTRWKGGWTNGRVVVWMDREEIMHAWMNGWTDSYTDL